MKDEKFVFELREDMVRYDNRSNFPQSDNSLLSAFGQKDIALFLTPPQPLSINPSNSSVSQICGATLLLHLSFQVY